MLDHVLPALVAEAAEDDVADRCRGEEVHQVLDDPSDRSGQGNKRERLEDVPQDAAPLRDVFDHHLTVKVAAVLPEACGEKAVRNRLGVQIGEISFGELCP
jgi:hypothetical protein